MILNRYLVSSKAAARALKLWLSILVPQHDLIIKLLAKRLILQISRVEDVVETPPHSARVPRPAALQHPVTEPAAGLVSRDDAVHAHLDVGWDVEIGDGPTDNDLDEQRAEREDDEVDGALRGVGRVERFVQVVFCDEGRFGRERAGEEADVGAEKDKVVQGDDAGQPGCLVQVQDARRNGEGDLELSFVVQVHAAVHRLIE
ncbi:hypothetical protein BM221_001140 [Beauveria bassiana]|uniref:Uncharacterized protein n=1 Tax=Beauveria bassiana TaxID=176275 RepID=A0A2N6P2H7_BEABA|nr:hypothetical protein BM221_001140 [Beauveria bassiana]